MQVYGYSQDAELLCLNVWRKIPLVNNELIINWLKWKQVQGNSLCLMDFQIVVSWVLCRIWHEDDRDGEKPVTIGPIFPIHFSLKKIFIRILLLNCFVLYWRNKQLQRFKIVQLRFTNPEIFTWIFEHCNIATTISVYTCIFQHVTSTFDFVKKLNKFVGVTRAILLKKLHFRRH